MKKLLPVLLFLVSLAPCKGVFACHNSSIGIDSVVPSGPNYIVYLTLCVGGGRTGVSTGADQNTGQFVFGFWDSSPLIISDAWPDTVTAGLFTNTSPYRTVVGGECPPVVNPFNFDCQVKYTPTIPGKWYTCLSSTAECGDTATYCRQFRFTMDQCPDSIIVLGIEGANIATNGCYPGSGFPYDMVVYPCSIGTSVTQEAELWNQIYYSSGEGSLYIDLNTWETGDFQVGVYSLSGSRITAQSFRKNQTRVRQEIPTGFLAPGIYFVTLEGCGKATARKFVVL